MSLLYHTTMPLFDNIAKAAKDFFIEETSAEGPSVAAPRPLPGQPAPATSTSGPAAFQVVPPLPAQPEQRHLDHIRQLLAGDGKDFMAFTKLVSSLQASGLSGPVLYQTAFNAFAAVTSLDLPALLRSAEQFELKLTSDRNSILERHREKVGEIRIPNVPPSPLVQLQQQEQQLQAGLADLARQLEEAQQRLLAVREQLQEQQQKAAAALASYELAHATAAAELKAHQQAVQAFLLRSGG
ncbi:hypothetical protein [Hymenobacter metallilatus]|uniref:Uncharacterized protein n=1 Tax=Hymenobacter metallilatus TaxID=2493666 RepID=A0A428JK77_9BACT|nr:hypothetical protein [Hymenobacter metallilatus]RSK33183.1 hypothetical protein EI290_10740 [Hymenobacter metallilatus]